MPFTKGISGNPEWAEFLMLTPEERADEMVRLKSVIENEEG